MDLLWTDFLNSDYHDWRGDGRDEDRLDRPDWLPGFLAQWQLSAPLPPTPADLAALKALRRLLLGLSADLVAGVALSPAALDQLNGYLAGGPVIRHLSPDGSLHLRPVSADWPQVMAAIAAAFAQTVSSGEGARVRICDNPDCRWVFYDETRNRTKRFCDDKMCGNLMKVRRFRARHKADG